MSAHNRKNSTFIAIGALAILGLVFAFQWFLQDDEYMIEMKRYREDLVQMMRTDPESPVPDSLKKDFPGLDFYDIDKAWRLSAKFEKNPKFQRIKMPRTDGKFDTYIIAGWAKFRYQSKEYRLTCYQPNSEDSKSLFVPFRDATSGKDTYGGGRYIDTRLLDGRLTLDFNKAYNPYCVYDYTGYACPVPPEENTLPFGVEAGEKNFEWKGI